MICIAGKNDIAVDSVYFLVNDYGVAPNDICVCISKSDSGEDTWQKSLAKAARMMSIDIVDLNDIQGENGLVFISLEFDRIIRPDQFLSSRLYNIHFSLLPKYKGMYTSVWPIINGERTTGVTLHRIDSGIDTGDIIDQVEFPLEMEDTARSVYGKYLKYGYHLFCKNVDDIILNKCKSHAQPAENASYYSKKSICFAHIEVDLNKTAYEIHNQLRAFIFPEYQLPMVCNKKIISTKLTQNKVTGGPRIVSSIDKWDIVGIDGYVVEAEWAENN